MDSQHSEKDNEREVFACGIGRILGNLQSLELLMRIFLNRTHGDPGENDIEVDLFDIEEGDRLHETPITNYDSLSQVIENYNNSVETVDESLKVDPSLIRIRDGLAHGRVIAQERDLPFHLFKFSQSKNRKVEVTHVIEIDEDWLNKQTNRLLREVEKVQEARELVSTNHDAV